MLPLSVPDKFIYLLWTKMNNTARLREIFWELSKMDPVDISTELGTCLTQNKCRSFLLLYLQHTGFSLSRSPVDVFQADN